MIREMHSVKAVYYPALQRLATWPTFTNFTYFFNIDLLSQTQPTFTVQFPVAHEADFWFCIIVWC